MKAYNKILKEPGLLRRKGLRENYRPIPALLFDLNHYEHNYLFQHNEYQVQFGTSVTKTGLKEKCCQSLSQHNALSASEIYSNISKENPSLFATTEL